MNRILIKVFWGNNSPIVSGSEPEYALLQSATYAHERLKKGHSDVFLFLFCGVDSKTEVSKEMASYGFPNQTIICIPADYEGDDLDYINDSEMDENIEYEIHCWLRKNYPGALPYLMDDNYKPWDLWWWSGIEASENWSWDENFARSLPDTHYLRSKTWMEILDETGDTDWDSWQGMQEFGLRMAMLCEWLHGFEQVTENSFNLFEAIPEEFGLDSEYVIYAAMKINGECGTLSIDEAEDGKDLSSQALHLLVCENRYNIPCDLSEYFGGDHLLFYTLWLCLWPDYKITICESIYDINQRVRLGDDRHIILNGWEFVSDGWSDRAEPL